MNGQFKIRLQNALDKFDIANAERLLDEIHTAEETGYGLTATEDRLWNRLTACVSTYYRTAAAIDS